MILGRAALATRIASLGALGVSAAVVLFGACAGWPWPRVCSVLDTLLFAGGSIAVLTGLLLAKPGRPPPLLGPANPGERTDSAAPAASALPSDSADPTDPAGRTEPAPRGPHGGTPTEAQALAKAKGRSLECLVAGGVWIAGTVGLYQVRVPLGDLYGWQPPTPAHAARADLPH